MKIDGIDGIDEIDGIGGIDGLDLIDGIDLIEGIEGIEGIDKAKTRGKGKWRQGDFLKLDLWVQMFIYSIFQLLSTFKALYTKVAELKK